MRNLQDAWRYEIVRQADLQTGPLDDESVNRLAVKQSPSMTDRLLIRARLLGPVVQAELGIASVRRVARLLLSGSTVLAFFVGASAGLAALGDPGRAVNVLWALLTVLLVPSVSLAIWVLSLGFGLGSGGWLGQRWKLALGRLAGRGPTARAWQAFLAMAQAAGVERAAFSLLTHLLWSAALLGLLLAMVVAFSLRHYTFVWQTTWLDSHVFVQLAQAIGVIPSWLGFVGPDAPMIAASGNAPLDDSEARARWASWLLGAVVTYGLLPRLLLLGCFGLLVRRSLIRPFLLPRDAYAIALTAKLQRLADHDAIDGPSGPPDRFSQAQFLDPALGRGQAMVALECRDAEVLMSGFTGKAVRLPPMDDHASRLDALACLESLHPARLLVVCDSGQTPDRGLVNALYSLSPKTVALRVLLSPPLEERDRRRAWRKTLADMGLPPPFEQSPPAWRWLEGGVHG